MRFKIIERHADRHGNAFTADDAFAIAQRRNGIEEPARAFRHGGLHESLVAIVVKAHRNDRTALRKHAFGKVGRALGNQPQRNPVFAAFLGNPRQDPTNRRTIGVLLARHIAVRFFANEQDRPGLLIARPDRIVERQARQNGDHRRGDF